MRLFLRRPRRGSTAGMMLAREVDALAMRRRNSRYVYRAGDCIINWGVSSMLDNVPDEAYINHPRSVGLAVDKRTTWTLLRAAKVPTVEWTEDHAEALRWLREENERCLVRTSLTSSQGRGISVFSRDGTDWSQPMYEMFDEGHTYVKCFTRNPADATEYRVHVFDGQVIDIVQKKRRRDYEGTPNPYIRSHRNGWIFARQGIDCPELVNATAQAAVAALGLDFGAVDIASDAGGERVCVYEINTAPGIEGTTLVAYRDAIHRRHGHSLLNRGHDVA